MTKKLTESQKRSLLLNKHSAKTAIPTTDILKTPLAKVAITVTVLYGSIIISRLFIKELAKLVVVTKKLRNARRL